MYTAEHQCVDSFMSIPQMVSVISHAVQARDELTDAMCRKEMGVYTAIFSTSGDTAALERADRRYLWLRKRLSARQEVGVLCLELQGAFAVCLRHLSSE